MWDFDGVCMFYIKVEVVTVNVFRECCGVVTKWFKSTSKCTALLSCLSGELFAVTAFKNTKGAEKWFKELQQGQVK